MLQPQEVIDFSGGFTDSFLAGPPTKGERFDNLLISNNRKPFTRFGSETQIDTQDQSLNGIKRIGYIFDHRNNIFTQSERHLYYGFYTELLGPTGNPALSAGTESNHISKAFWNNHSLIVSDSGAKPVKVRMGLITFRLEPQEWQLLRRLLLPQGQ